MTWAYENLSWTLEGQRLGRLPNYDEDAYIEASYTFNTTLQVDFTDHVRGSLTVTNLFDRWPLLLPETGLAANSTYSDLLGRQFRIGLRMETR